VCEQPAQGCYLKAKRPALESRVERPDHHTTRTYATVQRNSNSVCTENYLPTPNSHRSTRLSLYALVLHLCLTGLPEVAMPYSDMWQDCRITFQHTPPCYAKSSYRSVDLQTLHGNVHQVDHVPNGPTNSAAITTMFPLRLCRGKLLVAVTRERRYGPSRLRVNDDYYDYDATRQSCRVLSRRVGWCE